MKQMVNDLITAIHLTRSTRRARREGQVVSLVQCTEVPIFEMSYWGFTMEGCLFFKTPKMRELNQIISDLFETFDEETQRKLTFIPENRGWVERARFWQKELLPVLTKEQYHVAMIRIVSWYAHCLRRRWQGI